MTAATCDGHRTAPESNNRNGGKTVGIVTASKTSVKAQTPALYSSVCQQSTGMNIPHGNCRNAATEARDDYGRKTIRLAVVSELSTSIPTPASQLSTD